MTHPRMMPGQTPYTDEELTRLYQWVADAADGDPGEDEEWRLLPRAPRSRDE